WRGNRGQWFAGELGVLSDRSTAKRSGSEHPRVLDVGSRFGGSRLPQSTAGDPVVGEYRHLRDRTLIALLHEGDFGDVGRQPRQDAWQLHSRRADQDAMPIGAQPANAEIDDVLGPELIFL